MGVKLFETNIFNPFNVYGGVTEDERAGIPARDAWGGIEKYYNKHGYLLGSDKKPVNIPKEEMDELSKLYNTGDETAFGIVSSLGKYPKLRGLARGTLEHKVGQADSDHMAHPSSILFTGIQGTTMAMMTSATARPWTEKAADWLGNTFIPGDYPEITRALEGKEMDAQVKAQLRARRTMNRYLDNNPIVMGRMLFTTSEDGSYFDGKNFSQGFAQLLGDVAPSLAIQMTLGMGVGAATKAATWLTGKTLGSIINIGSTAKRTDQLYDFYKGYTPSLLRAGLRRAPFAVGAMSPMYMMESGGMQSDMFDFYQGQKTSKGERIYSDEDAARMAVNAGITYGVVSSALEYVPIAKWMRNRQIGGLKNKVLWGMHKSASDGLFGTQRLFKTGLSKGKQILNWTPVAEGVTEWLQLGWETAIKSHQDVPSASMMNLAGGEGGYTFLAGLVGGTSMAVTGRVAILSANAIGRLARGDNPMRTYFNGIAKYSLDDQRTIFEKFRDRELLLIDDEKERSRLEAIFDKNIDTYLNWAERKGKFSGAEAGVGGVTDATVEEAAKDIGIKPRGPASEEETPVGMIKDTLGMNEEGQQKRPNMNIISEDERRSEAENTIARYNKKYRGTPEGNEGMFLLHNLRDVIVKQGMENPAQDEDVATTIERVIGKGKEIRKVAVPRIIQGIKDAFRIPDNEKALVVANLILAGTEVDTRTREKTKLGIKGKATLNLATAPDYFNLEQVKEDYGAGWEMISTVDTIQTITEQKGWGATTPKDTGQQPDAGQGEQQFSDYQLGLGGQQSDWYTMMGGQQVGGGQQQADTIGVGDVVQFKTGKNKEPFIVKGAGKKKGSILVVPQNNPNAKPKQAYPSFFKKIGGAPSETVTGTGELVDETAPSEVKNSTLLSFFKDKKSPEWLELKKRNLTTPSGRPKLDRDGGKLAVISLMNELSQKGQPPKGTDIVSSTGEIVAGDRVEFVGTGREDGYALVDGKKVELTEAQLDRMDKISESSEKGGDSFVHAQLALNELKVELLNQERMKAGIEDTLFPELTPEQESQMIDEGQGEHLRDKNAAQDLKNKEQEDAQAKELEEKRKKIKDTSDNMLDNIASGTNILGDYLEDKTKKGSSGHLGFLSQEERDRIENNLGSVSWEEVAPHFDAAWQDFKKATGLGFEYFYLRFQARMTKFSNAMGRLFRQWATNTHGEFFNSSSYFQETEAQLDARFKPSQKRRRFKSELSRRKWKAVGHRFMGAWDSFMQSFLGGRVWADLNYREGESEEGGQNALETYNANALRKVSKNVFDLFMRNGMVLDETALAAIHDQVHGLTFRNFASWMGDQLRDNNPDFDTFNNVERNMLKAYYQSVLNRETWGKKVRLFFSNLFYNEKTQELRMDKDGTYWYYQKSPDILPAQIDPTTGHRLPRTDVTTFQDKQGHLYDPITNIPSGAEISYLHNSRTLQLSFGDVFYINTQPILTKDDFGNVQVEYDVSQRKRDVMDLGRFDKMQKDLFLPQSDGSPQFVLTGGKTGNKGVIYFTALLPEHYQILADVGWDQWLQDNIPEELHDVLNEEIFDMMGELAEYAGKMSGKEGLPTAKDISRIGALLQVGIVAKHEWFKEATHNDYQFSDFNEDLGYGKQATLEDMYKRLRISFAEGSTSYGHGEYNIFTVDNKNVRFRWNDAEVNVLEDVLDLNEEKYILDGMVWSSENTMDKTSQLNGAKNAYEMKTFIWYRSPDGEKYLAVKHGEFLAREGMEVVDKNTGKVIAKTIINDSGKIQLQALDAEGNFSNIDFLTTNEEVKSKSDATQFNTIYTIPETSRLLQKTSKNTSDAPFSFQWMDTLLPLYDSGDQNVVNAVNTLVGELVRRSHIWMQDLFSFGDNPQQILDYYSYDPRIFEDDLTETERWIKLITDRGINPDLLKHSHLSEPMESHLMNAFLKKGAFTSKQQGMSTTMWIRGNEGRKLKSDRHVEVSYGNRTVVEYLLGVISEKAPDLSTELEELYEEGNKAEFVEKINEYLSEDTIELGGIAIRNPVPDPYAVGVLRIQGIDPHKGNFITVHQNHTFRRLQGDHDSDVVQMHFFENPDVIRAVETITEHQGERSPTVLEIFKQEPKGNVLSYKASQKYIVQTLMQSDLIGTLINVGKLVNLLNFKKLSYKINTEDGEIEIRPKKLNQRILLDFAELDPEHQSVIRETFLDKSIDEKIVSKKREVDTGQLQRKDKISRKDVDTNPDKIFLFGDTTTRIGGAKYGRGQPNAIGIVIKKTEGRRENAYFTDDTYADNIEAIDADLAKVENAVENNKIIVMPTDGIVFDEDMIKKAPKTFNYLTSRLNEILPIEETEQKEGLFLETNVEKAISIILQAALDNDKFGLMQSWGVEDIHFVFSRLFEAVDINGKVLDRNLTEYESRSLMPIYNYFKYGALKLMRSRNANRMPPSGVASETARIRDGIYRPDGNRKTYAEFADHVQALLNMAGSWKGGGFNKRINGEYPTYRLLYNASKDELPPPNAMEIIFSAYANRLSAKEDGSDTPLTVDRQGTIDAQGIAGKSIQNEGFFAKNVAKYFTSRDGKEVRKLAYVSHKFATSMIRSFNLAFSDRLKQSDTKINTMTMMYNDVVQQITNLYLPYWSGTKPLDTLFRKGSGATEKLRNAVKGIKMTDDRGMQYYATLTFLSNVLQNINLKTTNNVYMLPYDMMNEDAIVEWAKHWVEAYNKPDISSSFKKNTEKKMLWNQVGDAVEEIACKK